MAKNLPVNAPDQISDPEELRQAQFSLLVWLIGCLFMLAAIFWDLLAGLFRF